MTCFSQDNMTGWRTEFERLYLCRARKARSIERLLPASAAAARAANADRAAPEVLEIDGAPVACTTVGSGAPVVLLHASASSAAQWRELTARLSGRFTLIAPDQFGCGGTAAWAGRHPIGLRDHARLAAEVIRRQGQRVHLVGHSFGGAIALRLAADHPQLVRSLTLIEPVSFQLLRDRDADGGALYAEIRNLASAVFESTLSGHGHAGMQGFIDYWNGDGAWAQMPADMQGRLAMQIGGVSANFSAVFADTMRLADCAKIMMPTLVIAGDRSPGPARHVAALVARAVPHALRLTLAGGGHMLPLTHAGALAEAVAAHVESGAEPALAA